jgi:hypothetical protein
MKMDFAKYWAQQFCVTICVVLVIGSHSALAEYKDTHSKFAKYNTLWQH